MSPGSAILLIFPKYVAVLEGVEIADFYTTAGQTRRRYIDLCLIDASGNIDVIEIKKPTDDVVLARTLYRDNSVPTRELSGSIMQAEKYLFHLSKWGVVGERELTRLLTLEQPVVVLMGKLGVNREIALATSDMQKTPTA